MKVIKNMLVVIIAFHVIMSQGMYRGKPPVSSMPVAESVPSNMYKDILLKLYSDALDEGSYPHRRKPPIDAKDLSGELLKVYQGFCEKIDMNALDQLIKGMKHGEQKLQSGIEKVQLESLSTNIELQLQTKKQQEGLAKHKWNSFLQTIPSIAVAKEGDKWGLNQDDINKANAIIAELVGMNADTKENLTDQLKNTIKNVKSMDAGWEQFLENMEGIRDSNGFWKPTGEWTKKAIQYIQDIAGGNKSKSNKLWDELIRKQKQKFEQYNENAAGQSIPTNLDDKEKRLLGFLQGKLESLKTRDEKDEWDENDYRSAQEELDGMYKLVSSGSGSQTLINHYKKPKENVHALNDTQKKAWKQDKLNEFLRAHGFVFKDDAGKKIDYEKYYENVINKRKENNGKKK